MGCSRESICTVLGHISMNIDYSPEYSAHDLELLDSLDFLTFQYVDAVNRIEDSLRPTYGQSLIARALALQQQGSLPEDTDASQSPPEKAAKAQLADFLLKLGTIHSTFALKMQSELSPIVVEDQYLKAEINFQKSIAVAASTPELLQQLQQNYATHIEGHIAWLNKLAETAEPTAKPKIERDIGELTHLKSFCSQLLTDSSIVRFGFLSAREIVGGEPKTETVANVESLPVNRYLLVLHKNKIAIFAWPEGQDAPTIKYETPLMLVAFLNMNLSPPKNLPPYLKFSFAKKTQDGLEATFHFMHDSFVASSKGVMTGTSESGEEVKLPVNGWLQGDRMWLMCITEAFQEDRRQRQQLASNAMYNALFAHKDPKA